MPMDITLLSRLDTLSQRHGDIAARLNEPTVTNDMNNYRALTKEHADLDILICLYLQWQQAQADLNTAKIMSEDSQTSELREFAAEEIKIAHHRMLELAVALQLALLPKDPNDERNVFLEIRAGTGGDESALFSADLLRMYTRYAERQGWQVEIVSASSSDLGGYKEVIVRLAGHNVYSQLKFESGGHRVQRVPQTETQGRIHTSACTVAVLPEVDEIELVKLSPDDIRIDVFRASGAGGQHINKTESAVRITHLPTGIVAECQDGRSQHSNKAKAMQVLVSRIMAKREQAAHAEQASERKGLVGSGDRSDRIRTYNFPQGRMTDHRINLTLYKLDQLMDGDLNAFFQTLRATHQADLLAELAQSN
jgi:peptide chain release factor 1